MTEAITHSTVFDVVKRYAILAYGGFGTMLAVGLMVLGSLLVGLAVAVLLAGFELIDEFLEELSTGALLGSSLVILVVGFLFLGVATESPLGRGRRLVGFHWSEVGIARIVGVAVTGYLMLVLHRYLDELLTDLPEPFFLAMDGLEAVARAGLVVMPLIAVPLSVIARYVAGRWSSVPSLELPILFTVWAIAAMVSLS